jgi:hypothetical protein
MDCLEFMFSVIICLVHLVTKILNAYVLMESSINFEFYVPKKFIF